MSAKISTKVLVSAAAVGAGLMFTVVGCSSESKESPSSTTTTTTTAPESTSSTAPTLEPTTKGSLEPATPKPGDIGPGQVGDN